jgi:hypothetical protein
VAVDDGPRDAADDSQAHGAADLLAGVEHAGSHVRLLIGYPGNQGHCERDEDQASGRGEHEQWQADAGQILAVLVDAGESPPGTSPSSPAARSTTTRSLPASQQRSPSERPRPSLH